MYSGFDFLVSGTWIPESRFQIHSRNSGFLELNSRFQSPGFWISLHGASKYSHLSSLLARSAYAAHFFIGTSFYSLCSTSMWNFVLRSCMKDLNTWRQLFLSLPKLGCGPKNSSPGKFTYMYIWHFRKVVISERSLKNANPLLVVTFFAAITIIVAKVPLRRLLERTDKSCT